MTLGTKAAAKSEFVINIRCELSLFIKMCEGYSPGDGISDSSEKLLQKDMGKVMYL